MLTCTSSPTTGPKIPHVVLATSVLGNGGRTSFAPVVGSSIIKSSQASIEAVEDERYECVNFSASKKAPWTISNSTAKRSITRALAGTLIIEKTIRIKLIRVISKSLFVEVEFAVRHDDSIAGAKSLAINDDIRFNVTGTNWSGLQAENLIVY